MTEKEDLINKLLQEIDNHRPWEWCDQWDNQSQYYSWLRGRLRQIWSKDWTPKNDYLNQRKIDVPVKDETGQVKLYKSGKKKGQPVTRKMFKCEITGELIPASKPKGQRTALYNVDHIEDAGTCTNGLEACIFLFRLLTSPDNMQLISTEVHKILTHMKKHGMDWDTAVADKKAIEIQKGDDKKLLTSKGLPPASNAKLRREQIVKYLLENNPK